MPIPVVLSALVTACATYAPEPLSDRPDLVSDVHHLVASADKFPLPEVRTHRFDLRGPLDIDDVAMIAVANNPDLRASRSKIAVAEAQVFAAGILPNPQLNLDYGFLIGGPPRSTATILAGLVQEVVPLLTLPDAQTSSGRKRA
jgi:hypothetical protein